jgi:ApaG protein
LHGSFPLARVPRFSKIIAAILPAPATAHMRGATPVAARAELVCNACPQPGPALTPPMIKQYDIAVTAHTAYLAEQSDPDNGRHVFAYTIRIANTGAVAAQLISRHWIITDANNLVQEVKGMGVVGAQPSLQPGESYEYTSGSVIATAVGTMRGSYQMLAADGTPFEAVIPEFTLSMPRVLH